LAQQGLAKSAATKVPSSGQLNLKRVDGTMLEVSSFSSVNYFIPKGRNTSLCLNEKHF